MEKCSEYFDCKEIGCVRHKFEELKCWDIEVKSCKTHNIVTKAIRDVYEIKKESCKICEYYRTYNKTDIDSQK